MILSSVRNKKGVACDETRKTKRGEKPRHNYPLIEVISDKPDNPERVQRKEYSSTESQYRNGCVDSEEGLGLATVCTPS